MGEFCAPLHGTLIVLEQNRSHVLVTGVHDLSDWCVCALCMIFFFHSSAISLRVVGASTKSRN